MIAQRLYGKESKDMMEFIKCVKSRLFMKHEKLEYMLITRLMCDTDDDFACNIVMKGAKMKNMLMNRLKLCDIEDEFELHVKLTHAPFFDIPTRIVTFDEDEYRTEGVFTCGKCNSLNTRYREVQTRSGDESFTKFVSCMDCKNKWTVWD